MIKASFMFHTIIPGRHGPSFKKYTGEHSLKKDQMRSEKDKGGLNHYRRCGSRPRVPGRVKGPLFKRYKERSPAGTRARILKRGGIRKW